MKAALETLLLNVDVKPKHRLFYFNESKKAEKRISIPIQRSSKILPDAQNAKLLLFKFPLSSAYSQGGREPKKMEDRHDRRDSEKRICA